MRLAENLLNLSRFNKKNVYLQIYVNGFFVRYSVRSALASVFLHPVLSNMAIVDKITSIGVKMYNLWV